MATLTVHKFKTGSGANEALDVLQAMAKLYFT